MVIPMTPEYDRWRTEGKNAAHEDANRRIVRIDFTYPPGCITDEGMRGYADGYNTTYNDRRTQRAVVAFSRIR